MQNISELVKKAKFLLLGKIESEDVNIDIKRTHVVRKNAVISFISKFLNLSIAFFTVPLVLKYLDQYQYGVYATLISIITWIDLMDFGLGQGLRNKLSESYARGDINLSRKYISTTYAIMLIISSVFVVLFLIVNPFLSWSQILNVTNREIKDIDLLSYFVFIAFALRFVTSIINKVYFALQKSAWVEMTQLIGKIINLLSILLLISFTKPSLFAFGVINSLLTFLIPFFASLIFFRRKFKELAPSFKYVDFSYFKDIMTLGVKFFIIQICLLFIWSANNLLISHFAGPEYVTPYQISYTFFNYFVVFFSIINTPLWSAYTEAWSNNRVEWIKQSITRMKRLYVIVFGLVILFVFISPFIFRLWVGNQVHIPMSVTIFVAIMILINMWITIFDFFINGVGRIKLQMYISIVVALINVPLAYLFAVKLGMGTIGVILSTICCFSISAVTSPLQAYKILNNKAKGIWNR